MQSGKKVDVLKMLIQTYQRVFIHYGNLYYLKNSYFDNKTNLGDPHFFLSNLSYRMTFRYKTLQHIIP